MIPGVHLSELLPKGQDDQATHILCKLHKVNILDYKDTASAALEKDAIRTVKLSPTVTLTNPESERLAFSLRKQALEYNFYAHEVKFPVSVMPTILK